MHRFETILPIRRGQRFVLNFVILCNTLFNVQALGNVDSDYSLGLSDIY